MSKKNFEIAVSLFALVLLLALGFSTSSDYEPAHPNDIGLFNDNECYATLKGTVNRGERVKVTGVKYEPYLNTGVMYRYETKYGWLYIQSFEDDLECKYVE